MDVSDGQEENRTRRTHVRVTPQFADIPEPDLVLSQPSARTLYSWTILHKVLTRLNDFDGAVSTLGEALRAEQITPDAAGSTITSSLR